MDGPSAAPGSGSPRGRFTARYRLFFSIPGAARLLGGSLAGRMPLGMSSLAIVLLVRTETGSFASAGVVVGAFTLATAAAAPVAGTLVDRFGGRRVLPPMVVGQAGWLVVLVLGARAGAATALLAVIGSLAGALTPPVDACVRVLWPQIAPDHQILESAYAVDATAQEVIWTVGPLLVALSATASPSLAVLLTAAVGLLGTAWFLAAPLTRRAGGGGRSPARTASRAPRTGRALSSRGLRVVLAAALLMGFCVGAVEIAIPALALRAGSRGSAGLLLAMWSIGSMAAGLAYGARAWPWAPSSRYWVLLLLVAATTAPLILARSLAAAIPLSALAGTGYAPVLACQYGLVNLVAAAGAAAESFAWATASLVAGIAAGAAVSGVIAQNVGVSTSFALGCAVAVLAALAALAGRSRLRAAEAPA